ncbi:MAG: hypothetical protein U0359_40330 [Byssovorax sp.]
MTSNLRSFASILIAALSLGAVGAIAACNTPPPTTLNINTTGGSGGDSGSGGSGSTTGEGGGGGEGEVTTAKDFYIAVIDPELKESCASCHKTGQNGAPIFLASTPEGSYNAMDQHGGLIVAPENSLLILHGAHTGPALTAVQKSDVTEWLSLEVTERGLSSSSSSSSSGGMPAVTLQEALAAYGACMDIDDWKVNNLDKLMNAQTDAGPCVGCHSAGEGGNFLSANTQETFDKNTKFPFIKRQITGTVDDQGNFADLIPSNRWIEKGQAPCQPNTNCHPKYNLPPQLKDGINNFVQKTLDKWHNKQCGMMP